MKNLKGKYEISQSSPNTFWLTFNEENSIGESLTIELTHCENSGGNNSLPNLWYKKGYMNRVLENYWGVSTYVKDSEGRSWGKYNVQDKLSDDKKRMVIDFDWMLEATEENKEKLINEVYRIFMSATGKSATEEKIERVREYAKKNNIEVVTEIPEGWLKIRSAVDPIGSISVCNMKWNLKAARDGSFQRKLLLV